MKCTDGQVDMLFLVCIHFRHLVQRKRNI